MVAGSRFTYAIGQLTLWSSDPDRLSQNGPLVLRQGKFRHLALTNPKTAPYGRAALQVLKNLNLWDSLEGSVVQGESVSQTFHFIATGNAELGFVALSQALDPNLKIKGSRWDVPDHLHDPIGQDAGLIKKK